MGNCQFRQTRLDEAIASYTQALLQQPGDLQAKQNLEYCWKMKQQQQQKPDSTQQKPQNEQQQQQQQQKQQSRQAQARKGAISRDQADRMLQALQGKEKENLKNQPKRPSAKDAGGKDW